MECEGGRRLCRGCAGWLDDGHRGSRSALTIHLPALRQVLTLPTVNAKTGCRYAVDVEPDDLDGGGDTSGEDDDGGLVAVSLSGFIPAAAEASASPPAKQVLEIVVDDYDMIGAVSIKGDPLGRGGGSPHYCNTPLVCCVALTGSNPFRSDPTQPKPTPPTPTQSNPTSLERFHG